MRALFDHLAQDREKWLRRNAYFYEQDRAYMGFLVPPGLRILEIGCGNGQLLASLNPSHGVRIDLSLNMIDAAERAFPQCDFRVGDVEDEACLRELDQQFDVVIISDTIGLLDDCQSVFQNLHYVSTSDTRLIVAYYSRAWEPIMRVGEFLGLKMPQAPQNWLSTEDIIGMFYLADHEPIKREWRTLLPRRMFGLGTLINKYVAPIPIIRRLCLRTYVVARPMRNVGMDSPSATVLIPCRNERGNVEPAVQRVPRFCEDLEVLFVEGGSTDGTLAEIERVISAYPQNDIRVVRQPGKGKGDAVRHGFSEAKGDVLMILDGDLTVPPESLPKFYNAIVTGKGEFVNGTRLVYPMDGKAMRPLNEIANHFFSRLFSWLLDQRFTDTLCGTKVLTRANYEHIVANRAYFGEFDPFGDFDLIFGAAKLNLKIVELPVRYAARSYGETQISRFRHGLLLIRMVVFAFRKLKAL